MQPQGNNQLQIRKWWVTLRSSLYISFSVRPLSIPLNKKVPGAQQGKTQGDISIIQNNNASPINSTDIKCQT